MNRIAKIKIDPHANTKKVVRIGVISDTHISDPDWELPLKAREGLKNVDAIIHSGDLVSMKVIDILKKTCPLVYAVSGNMDLPETRNKLPSKEIISVGKYKIGVIHGHGHPGALIEIVSKAFQDECVDVIIFGHSHNPVNERIGGILYFNPGSLTDKMFTRNNSYGLIEIGKTIEGRIVRI